VDAATRGLWLKLTYYQNGQEQYLEWRQTKLPSRGPCPFCVRSARALSATSWA